MVYWLLGLLVIALAAWFLVSTLRESLRGLQMQSRLARALESEFKIHSRAAWAFLGEEETHGRIKALIAEREERLKRPLTTGDLKESVWPEVRKLYVEARQGGLGPPPGPAPEAAGERPPLPEEGKLPADRFLDLAASESGALMGGLVRRFRSDPRLWKYAFGAGRKDLQRVRAEAIVFHVFLADQACRRSGVPEHLLPRLHERISFAADESGALPEADPHPELKRLTEERLRAYRSTLEEPGAQAALSLGRAVVGNVLGEDGAESETWLVKAAGEASVEALDDLVSRLERYEIAEG